MPCNVSECESHHELSLKFPLDVIMSRGGFVIEFFLDLKSHMPNPGISEIFDSLRNETNITKTSQPKIKRIPIQ